MYIYIYIAYIVYCIFIIYICIIYIAFYNIMYIYIYISCYILYISAGLFLLGERGSPPTSQNGVIPLLLDDFLPNQSLVPSPLNKNVYVTN